ncbi:DNA internalization-related competence protein ComEC/Rec2 [Ureibacillus aquaedulcis]|uniref:DNA internalization-related competence protein ComEC/Rec2 n=1 Tax=Ureibacillus aquaedulcis TaxID=3058421 RepID=A0ABT8GV62_9BACL|nr:DNA internalization-related competence protein ComEC/Rec2 [Ureibacillus sp. BA0131]MDN4495312.1 DNA internalization-related competence protein ComEC/Rec2 [Ureibacillus sp. BA0131]
MISFKHKWIYYALSILVASIAAHESVGLLFLLLPFALFLHFKKLGRIHVAGTALIAFSSFIYFAHQLQQFDEPLLLPAHLTWTDEYKINGDTLRGFMKDAKGRSVYVVYNFNSESEKLNYQQEALAGTRYLVIGEVAEPSKPSHDYAFDMKNYLKSKGSLGIVEIAAWEFVGHSRSIPERIAKQRFNVKQHIENTFPPSLVAEAQALIIGLQENVDDEMTRAYQKLGITHLFAISGLHIAIVAFIFYQGLLRLGVRREFASIVLLVILPIYAILAGGAPSVWRAVLVVELMMVSRLVGKMAADDALSISFIIFVCLEPWSVFQIGFQLSYLATASLIYSSQFINRYSSWIVQSFLITFVSQLLVYPLLLFHFYELSLSSFIVNIFFVPLFSFIILPINILLLGTSYIAESPTDVLFLLYEPFRHFLTLFINYLQSIPFQMWNPGKPAIYLIVVAYISVFAAFYILDVGGKLKKVLAVLILPAIFVHFGGKLTNDLIITFINVGQGDCIVIELPFQEEVYLIDTGGVLRFNEEEWKKSSNPYEVGRDIVVPFLKGKGIHKIDKLILTHSDSDHVEGAEEVVQEIRIGEIHITPGSYKKDVMNDLLTEAKERNIPIVEQIANASWQVEGFTLTYLWPNETSYEGNNDSLVLYLTTGNFEGLFMGDVEMAGEESIIQQYPYISNIDVLKAGHHGSKTSSSEVFLERSKPAITVFSAGRDNRYGHPHQEVVERFQDLGLSTFNTGKVGTVEVRLDGETIEVKTGNGK